MSRSLYAPPLTEGGGRDSRSRAIPAGRRFPDRWPASVLERIGIRAHRKSPPGASGKCGTDNQTPASTHGGHTATCSDRGRGSAPGVPSPAQRRLPPHHAAGSRRASARRSRPGPPRRCASLRACRDTRAPDGAAAQLPRAAGDWLGPDRTRFSAPDCCEVSPRCGPAGTHRTEPPGRLSSGSYPADDGRVWRCAMDSDDGF